MQLKAKIKPGWEAEKTVTCKKTGTIGKPDVQTPSGKVIELKPNTPSWQYRGKQQLKRYESIKGRVIYYDKK